jgi:phospholipid-translocating ATPase
MGSTVCSLFYGILFSIETRFKITSFYIRMYDDKTDQPAKVNSTDLNEDLGQIEYLFSDKTGTLTDNQMIFKHFSIDGLILEEAHGRIYKITSQQSQMKLDKQTLDVSIFFKITPL